MGGGGVEEKGQRERDRESQRQRQREKQDRERQRQRQREKQRQTEREKAFFFKRPVIRDAQSSFCCKLLITAVHTAKQKRNQPVPVQAGTH